MCVVVTRDRVATLRRCLAAVGAQTRPPDHLVLVDNGPDPATRAVLEETGLPHTYLPSHTNLGGAGGFAYGILTARALGADLVWLADDDGRPARTSTLATLLDAAATHRLEMVSPLVVDADDPTLLAFPMRRRLSWARRVDELAGEPVVLGVANLFNGALFSAAALEAVGVPDPRLFIRGDEVEVHRRLARSGLRFGTATGARYLHPSGTADVERVLAGRVPLYLPVDPSRRDRAFRNLGYLTSQPGLRWRRWPDEARYAWYFLVERRDVDGWRQWLARSGEGRRERFAEPAA